METTTSQVYYKDNRGNVISNYDVEEAFALVTGKSRWEDERGYLRFLYGLLGKTIVSIVYPSVKGFLAAGSEIYAIKLYRETHGCNLLEAKIAIDNMKSEMQGMRSE